MSGVISMGIQCPIFRKGDDLKKIIIDSIYKQTTLEDGDVIGVTESIVARAQGNYVTVDDIAKETVRLFGESPIITICNPIYSRNRFSMILKGIARAAKKIYLVMPPKDEVGNPADVNPWTGVNIKEYYKNICEQENCECIINPDKIDLSHANILYCDLRPWELYGDYSITLTHYFRDKCDYGLLGSNKANEETLKLFPNTNDAINLIHSIKWEIKDRFGVDIEVMIYGDGCFKDPIGGIWEFADPVTSPAYTSGLRGSPNEIKLKAFADDKFANLSGDRLTSAIKNEIKSKDKNLVGNMQSQGTTPRRYVDLLASLMDLTSGSGDKGTPVVVVKNYFKNYSC